MFKMTIMTRNLFPNINDRYKEEVVFNHQQAIPPINSILSIDGIEFEVNHIKTIFNLEIQKLDHVMIYASFLIGEINYE